MNALRSRFATFAWTACILVGPMGWAARAVAQKAPTRDRNKTLVQSESVLRDRNRDEMHKGDALELVGREQEDNDLRSRTPALANSDRAIAQVDSDDNYRRMLAMYDQGAHFNAPPVTTPGSAPNALDAPTAARPHGTPSAPPAKRPSWAWPVLLALAGVAVLAARKRLMALTVTTDAQAPKPAPAAAKPVRVTVSP